MPTLDLHHVVVSSPTPTPRVLQLAALFGLDLEAAGSQTIIPHTTLDLEPGHIVFITGASGGGKTTLLRLIARSLAGQPGVEVLRLDDLATLPAAALVDALPAATLDAVLAALSLAGLNDAFVMLRKPDELSEGQRFRLRLAQAMLHVTAATTATAERDAPPSTTERSMTVILADEFAATLDRITARAIAANLHRWMRRPEIARQCCFIVATTHDDLLESLAPDVLVEITPGKVHVLTRRDCCRR